MSAALVLATAALAAWLYLLLLRGFFWVPEELPPAEGAARPHAVDGGADPSVAAIVPARDEAETIGAVVGSLLAQDYRGDFRIVLVDDHSTDGTARIALEAAEKAGACERLTVIAAAPLPPGWTGKLWALNAGMATLEASGAAPDLLLFTDADIAHAPDNLSSLVAALEDGRRDLVSLMVKLRCETWAERFLVPAFVFFFAMIYPFAWVGDREKRTAAAAGGCMLLRREIYHRAGGLAAIRGALIDDCALARAVKDKGGVLHLAMTQGTRSLRPYPRIGDIWAMVARSAYTQLGHSPLVLAATVLGLAIVFLAPPLLLAAGGEAAALALAAWALMAACYAPMLRLLSPLAPLRAAAAARRGGLSWRDAQFRTPPLRRQGRRVEGKGAMAEPALGAVETPSGKGRGDENFPVGSFLIRRELRPHVHAFYRFAREADDVADNPALAPGDKVRRLDRMGAVLDGAPGTDAPAARAMRASLAETGVSAQHCHDVLTAFRLDATKLRYRDWDDLMEYCRYSAAPVGRQLLDLHGEGRQSWTSSDALCSALQVLNHLQDCGADYRALDRVYIPENHLAISGARVEDLAASRTSPELRDAIERLLDSTDRLIAQASYLPPAVRSVGLRRECAVIVGLARRLSRRLRRGDPLATRVKLTRGDFAAAFVVGFLRGSA